MKPVKNLRELISQHSFNPNARSYDSIVKNCFRDRIEFNKNQTMCSLKQFQPQALNKSARPLLTAPIFMCTQCLAPLNFCLLAGVCSNYKLL